jgi:hypothetical protein
VAPAEKVDDQNQPALDGQATPVAIEKHAGMPADLVREAIDEVSLEGDIYT